jgi:ubiquinone/menaquinone biosynthesis C-methylase UbiE
MHDNTKRFSNRVDNYVKYRPSYPTEIIPFLEKQIGFNSGFVVADIGSGTGILSKILLNNGNKVYGIEPNTEMRNKAEELLGSYTSFKSINGTAEQTTLPGVSVNIITAAQAFHWFDVKQTKVEFKRITKPGSYCMLLWNERLASSAFEKAYEQLLLNYTIDYKEVNHRNVNEGSIAEFFEPHRFIKQTFSNKQVFDFEGLKGRLLTSSYAPDEHHAEYNNMIKVLKDIFITFNQNNIVQFNYETKLYVGNI